MLIIMMVIGSSFCQCRLMLVCRVFSFRGCLVSIVKVLFQSRQLVLVRKLLIIGNGMNSIRLLCCSVFSVMSVNLIRRLLRVMVMVIVVRILVVESWVCCMVVLMLLIISESRLIELEFVLFSMKGSELVKQIISRYSMLVMNISGSLVCSRVLLLLLKIMMVQLIVQFIDISVIM